MSQSRHVSMIALVVLSVVAPGGASPSLAREVAAEPTPVLLLEQTFERRAVDKVEIGDFHFTRGQLAPVHTHAAPVFGYVSRGKIKYQVRGQPERVLNTGDAFFEPVGPDVVHFDDAGDQAAVFTDFNFERPNEPFIKFAKPFTGKIDRRTLPTARLSGEVIDKVEVYAYDVRKGQRIAVTASDHSRLWYVDAGEALLQLIGAPAQRIPAASPSMCRKNGRERSRSPTAIRGD